MKYQWFTFLSSNLQKVINWFSSLVVSTFIFRDYKFVPLEIKLMVFPFGPFSFMTDGLLEVNRKLTAVDNKKLSFKLHFFFVVSFLAGTRW